MIENYEKIAEGHWYQRTITGPMPDYSKVYSETRYDTYSTTDKMSELRFNLLQNKIGNINSICDFGYGNGSFLRHCDKTKQVKQIYGYDISDYPVPDGAIKINEPTDVEVDVMTFFDSLEHLIQRDLTTYINKLKIKHICVSVPWMHESQGSYFFRNWKHRRENEHIHHFDCHGLINLLTHCDYKIIHVGNDEDAIRTPYSNLPNILTVIGTKK